MGRKRTSVKKVREIIRLKTLDMSERSIARALKISRPVVSACLKNLKNCGKTYKQIKNISDSELQSLLDNQPCKNNKKNNELSQYFPYFVCELKRKGVTLNHLWIEYKEKHPNGYQYSQFCYHFQMWKKDSEIRMHIEHKAGDKMFVDYAGTKMCIYDRETEEAKEVETFVAILGASGLTYVEVSESQEKENWIRSNERALWYFGGVPKAIVPDNLKSAVSKSDPYEPGINSSFDDFSEHYGTVIIPARVRKARDKALVENAVNIVYIRIYAPLRNRKFYSIEELNEAIKELLEKHNNTPFQRMPYSRRELFEEIERKELRRLAAEKYPDKKIQMATVGVNYHAELREDRHYYSLPHYIRKRGVKVKVKLVYDERIVAIYYDNIRIIQHFRDKTPNGYTTVPEHMPSHHRLYAEWSKERIINWGSKYGKDVVNVLEGIFNDRKHPEQAYRVCFGLLGLRKKYGVERLQKACKKACKYKIYSFKRIQSIIQVIMEQDNQPELDWNKPIPEHENIRGNEYYN